MQGTTQYFEKQFFYKQVLDCHCPSNILCQISGRQNQWSLVFMYIFQICQIFRLRILQICLFLVREYSYNASVYTRYLYRKINNSKNGQL